MRKIGTAIAAAAIPALTVLAAPAHAASTQLLLTEMRSCDFHRVSYAQTPGKALPYAHITSDGHTATAQVDIRQGTPNAQYVVRLIPAPHAKLGCLAGDPSIGTASLTTDGAGTGSATAQVPIGSGVTGMWVAVDLPAPHSQTPNEFYTSSFTAPV